MRKGVAMKVPWWIGVLVIIGCALLLMWSKGELHLLGL